MRYKGKKVLVTGGSGFAGSNLVDKLVEKEAEVTVLDDFFTGHRDNLKENLDSINLVKGDVRDCTLLKKLMENVDVVFHEAARNIIVSTKNPREDYEVNIGGTLNVLLVARDCDIKRVVYISSASVYGNPRYLPINEDDGTNLLSPYAVSKYAGENYCMAFYESYGVPTTALRYSNVYGPRQDPKNPYCGVVAKFIENVRENKPPMIHGDGQQTRDFSYVKDVVEATMLAGYEHSAVGEVFNVGTGIETNVNTLAEDIIDIYGKDLKPRHIDKRDIDNIRRRVLNIEKIRRKLKWTPNYTLKQGLQETIDWFEQSIV